MNKLFKIFVSQIFNSFFPLLIVAILLHISNTIEIASIFIVINFANTYLLFSDYSSNIRFVKDAMRLGGIKKNPPLEIVKDINTYLGIKTIILIAGFIPWLAITYFTPLLYQNLFTSILSYTFIIGYNLNFYWIYTTSNKEYYFILSNFFSRFSLVILLLFFIHLPTQYRYVMFYAGLLSTATALLFFLRFCKMNKIHIDLSVKTLKHSAKLIIEDFKLVANNFALMTPTMSLTFFLGYINQPKQIAIYALAEKLFLGIRTFLSIAINSIYPVLCNRESLSANRVKKMALAFYATIITVCTATYFIAPLLLPFLKISLSLTAIFQNCLFYFLLVIIVISLNVPLMLWLLISNEIQSKKTSLAMFVSAGLIIAVFVTNAFQWNTVVSLVKSLLIGESVILSAFLLLYKYRRTGFTPQPIVPSVQNIP